MKTKYIIFDLDDTLVYEIDYLYSAYREIASYIDPEHSEALYDKMVEGYHKKINVFEYLHQEYGVVVQELLSMYRNHKPTISLIQGANEVLEQLRSAGHKIGVITDGRSVTQRNKLKALEIEDWFDLIIVSEEVGSTKPDPRNFVPFVSQDIEDYFYVADNPKKDFITPNQLGWTTLCLLDQGKNIHKQNFELEKNCLPQHTMLNIVEVLNYI